MERRYAQKFKETCLSLNFESPTPYWNLSKTFALLSRRFLSKLTQLVKFHLVCSDNIFETIALNVDKKFTENKFSLLYLDEMFINFIYIFFNISNDEIIRFDDKG